MSGVNKGLVVERNSNWAVLLLPNGEYRRIRTKEPLEVGELYQVRARPVTRYALVAVLLLTFTILSVDYFSVKAYAQVSSLVEMGVNRWGRVITVRAIGSEGEQVLEKVQVKHQSVEGAVYQVVNGVLKNRPAEARNNQEFILSVKARTHADKEIQDKLLTKMSKGLKQVIPPPVKDNSSRDKKDDPQHYSKPEKKLDNGIQPSVPGRNLSPQVKKNQDQKSQAGWGKPNNSQGKIKVDSNKKSEQQNRREVP